MIKYKYLKRDEKEAVDQFDLETLDYAFTHGAADQALGIVGVLAILKIQGLPLSRDQEAVLITVRQAVDVLLGGE